MCQALERAPPTARCRPPVPAHGSLTRKQEANTHANVTRGLGASLQPQR